MALYRVYILANGDDRFYVGLTEDLEQRIAQHNHGKSRWTKGKGPWRLVWKSQLMSLTEARKLENRLKRQGRGAGFFGITGLSRGS